MSIPIFKKVRGLKESWNLFQCVRCGLYSAWPEVEADGHACENCGGPIKAAGKCTPQEFLGKKFHVPKNKMAVELTEEEARVICVALATAEPESEEKYMKQLELRKKILMIRNRFAYDDMGGTGCAN